jgi:hypothetical protein
MPKVISANRLVDGIVIYMGSDGSWHESLARAKIFAAEAEAEAGLSSARADVKRNLIIDPFFVEISFADDCIGQESGEKSMHALSLRNKIRACGPTIDYAPRIATQSARA